MPLAGSGPQHGQGIAADQGHHQKEHPGEQEELLGRNGRLGGEKGAEWEGGSGMDGKRAVEREALGCQD